MSGPGLRPTPPALHVRARSFVVLWRRTVRAVKLLFDVLRLVATKFVAVLLVASLLVAAAFLWFWVKDQKNLRAEAAVLRGQIDQQLADWQQLRRRALDLEAQRAALEAARPNQLLHPLDHLEWKARLQAANAAVASAQTARDRARAIHDETLRRCEAVEARFDEFYIGLLGAARRTWRLLALAVLAFLAGPFLAKALWYFGIAPLARFATPLQLTPGEVPGSCRALASGKVLEVAIHPAQPLLTRMAWLQQYDPSLAKRTRFLFDWRSPFTSYAAGLHEMTEVTARPGESGGTAHLTAAADPNAYLIALELDRHPGLVLHPGAVVAVRGDIRMHARWRLGSLHAWIAGRLRHILFSGSGTLYVTGHAGVDLVQNSRPVVVEEALILGYDSRSRFAAVRTETFWPFFRDHTSLFDYRFDGQQPFLRQTAAAPDSRAAGNPFRRVLQTFLNALGNLLGF